MQGEPETPINRKSKPKFEVRKKPKHGLHFALQANTPMNANGKLQVIFLLALLLHSARPPPPLKEKNDKLRFQGPGSYPDETLQIPFLHPYRTSFETAAKPLRNR